MSLDARKSAAEHDAGADDLVQRIGQLTRTLHENMRELGLDKEIERAAEAIPDARDRLNYVATMTEQAADRALSAIDRAQPVQDRLCAQAESLDRRWGEWFQTPVELDQARELVKETRAYLGAVPGMTEATNKELLEIMMAQDFQDLTGQVIKKMMDVIREIEHQLVRVLLDNIPEGRERGIPPRRAKVAAAPTDEPSSLLNGPQVKPGDADSLSSQDEVDDLLDELGF